MMESNSHDENSRSGEEERTGWRRSGPNFWLLLIALAILVVFLVTREATPTRIPYSFFLEQIKAGNVLTLRRSDTEAYGRFKNEPVAPPKFDEKTNALVVPTDSKTGEPQKLGRDFRVDLVRDEQSAGQLTALLADHPEILQTADPVDNTLLYLYLAAIMLPIVLIVAFWVMFRRSRNDVMGSNFLSGFTKSPAKRYEASKQAVTFNDVAGLEGVKADLIEIVDFLKNPDKFQRLGGRIPKGVLLNGPPGTGKTLLARAVAGEAGVPFYSVSGSEFIQMFVGVGASRVRDLFRTAKEKSPSIIFIDEIDAVGRQRGAGLGGGHDEREQTLNQILSEMDGFTQTDAVIVVAATNRPDVLDPALLRPGRFDRHVTVGRPTQKGRLEIFKVHVRHVPLDDDVDLERLAAATVGLTGADIRNIVNEAALWAARHNKSSVNMHDFDFARDKVLMGAKREEVLTAVEKEKTAYHEAGHTLCAWNLTGAYRVHKVTIIPRGRSLGVTQTVPSEDRLSMSENELRDHLIVLLAGRAAETLVYQETTVGAENDLERATGMARRMVTHWGMSDRLGPVSYKLSDEDPFLGREIHKQRQFSEHTMELIDEEVARILHDAAAGSTKIVTEKRDQLETIARALLVEEELDEAKITELIGPSVQAQAAQSNGRAGQVIAPPTPAVESGPGAQPANRDGDPPSTLSSRQSYGQQ